MSDGTDWVVTRWPQLMILIFASGTAGQVPCVICVFINIYKYTNNSNIDGCF